MLIKFRDQVTLVDANEIGLYFSDGSCLTTIVEDYKYERFVDFSSMSKAIGETLCNLHLYIEDDIIIEINGVKYEISHDIRQPKELHYIKRNNYIAEDKYVLKL